MKPLFTIIITTYNRSTLLPRAIHSALNQTFKQFQLVIVDDHSTDNTSEIIATFADSRLEVLRLPENHGVSAARNIGIQQAKGQYITFLDDDDELLPEFLEKINQFLQKQPHAFKGIIGVGIQRINELNENQIPSIETCILTLDKKKTFILKTLFLSSITIHRSCFTQAGYFNETLSLGEDLELFIRMIIGADIPCAALPYILAKRYFHNLPSLSRPNELEAKINNLKRFIHLAEKNLKPEHKELWVRLHYFLLGVYYPAGKKIAARQLAKKILKKKFFSPKIWEIILRFELIKPFKYNLKRIYKK